MSIVAIENVPAMVGLKEVVKNLRKPIPGPFEALNFGRSNNSNQMKICYIRLSPKLDPVQIVQNINRKNYKSRGKYFAYIPDKIPDIQLGTSKKSIGKRAPLAVRKQLRNAKLNADGRIIDFATDEIVAELQAKYPGLYALSEKCEHKLLLDITKTISTRVERLVNKYPNLEESCFQTTRAYRRAHAHRTDFALVRNTYRALYAPLPAPGGKLQEADIASSSTHLEKEIDMELPLGRVRSLCDKYSPKIVTKMGEHINALDTLPSQLDFEEDIAKKRVRQELKRMLPFMSYIVSQVLNKQLQPPEQKHYKVRIYGEPFLPPKGPRTSFLARFQPLRALRSTRMFNMLKLSVPAACYHQLLAMHGSVLSGSKLIIASSDVVMFKTSSFSSGEKEEEGEGPEEEAEGASEDEVMDDDQDEMEGENWGDDMEM